MLRHAKPCSASWTKACARSLTRYRTLVPRAVSRSSSNACHVAKVRSSATVSSSRYPVGRSRQTSIIRSKKRFIDSANDLAHLSPSTPVLLPGLGRLQQSGLQRLHHLAQGRGRTPRLRLKMQPREKLAHRVQPYTALEAKDIEGGDHQPAQPLPALFGFP